MTPKFRAWDSEANIMIYSDHRTRKLYDVYYGFEMNREGELECRWEGEFTESHVLDGGTLDNLMQFTGIHDKNGKEIYEGDICYLEGNKLYGQVIFTHGMFCFKSESVLNSLFGLADDVSVRGNIYQNSELLEVD